MRWRAHLAEVFHEAFRREHTIAQPPWSEVSDRHRTAVIAVIDELNADRGATQTTDPAPAGKGEP
jgi:hypothetical protein